MTVNHEHEQISNIYMALIKYCINIDDIHE